MTQTVRIVRRIRPCTCGCRGRDYWHRASYRRAISGRRPAAGVARTDWDRAAGTPIQAEAWAELPWGKTRVVQMAAEPGRPGWWMVDLDDALCAEHLTQDRCP